MINLQSILAAHNPHSAQLFKEDLNKRKRVEDTEEFKFCKNYIQNNKRGVYIKGYFDKLENWKDYSLYRYRLSNCVNLKNELFMIKFIAQKEGKEYSSELLTLSYWIIIVLNTYIGYSVEEAVKELLKENNIKFKSNVKLDNKEKTDILVNKKLHIQLKKASFLDGMWSMDRIDKYKKYEKLHFMFYEVSENAIINIINFKNYDNSVAIKELSGFYATENATLEHFINNIKKLSA